MASASSRWERQWHEKRWWQWANFGIVSQWNSIIFVYFSCFWKLRKKRGERANERIHFIEFVRTIQLWDEDSLHFLHIPLKWPRCSSRKLFFFISSTQLLCGALNFLNFLQQLSSSTKMHFSSHQSDAAKRDKKKTLNSTKFPVKHKTQHTKGRVSRREFGLFSTLPGDDADDERKKKRGELV